MITNKKFILTINVLFLLNNFLIGQPNTDFEKNIVKIKGRYESYGFITGIDKPGKSVYFITIQFDRGKKNLRTDNELKVFTSTGKGKSGKTNYISSTMLHTPIRLGSYVICLYEIKENLPVEDRYYISIAASMSHDFYTVKDQYKKETDLFNPVFANQKFIRLKINGKDLLQEPFNLETNEGAAFSLGGLPVIDEQGNIVAVMAQIEDEGEKASSINPIITALDITAIQKVLFDLGKKENQACKYFNIIEKGAYRDETPCQKEERLAKEEIRRKKEEEEQRAQQLKQQDLKRKIEMYKEGNREAEITKTYNMNRDRFIALSIGGAGFVTYLTMKGSSGGNSNNTNSSNVGYSVGGNLYFSPDKGHFRVVLEPRYSDYSFSINNSYKYQTSSDFALSKLTSKVYELTIIPEVVTKRSENGDNFFGIGYGISKNISTGISYALNGKSSTEPVIDDIIYSHYLIVELGSSRGRIRYNLFAKYQIAPFTKNDYQLILNGQLFNPLRDVSKNYWVLGMDFQLRLWNRWKNDYRTMF